MTAYGLKEAKWKAALARLDAVARARGAGSPEALAQAAEVDVLARQLNWLRRNPEAA